VKRLIGRFLVVGLLSGGAMFVVASPSSAARDNPCMDQANYNSEVQWYQDMWTASFDNWVSWVGADYQVDPQTGQETWEASYLGGTYTVDSLSAYQHELSMYSAQMAMFDRMLNGFVNTWGSNICP
jgi:hypothetical protein